MLYAIIGVLAITVAAEKGGNPEDQKGALQAVADKPFGIILLGLLALGLTGYALWQLVEVVVGPRDKEGVDAHAKRADVELVVGTDVLLRITDDGVGPIDVDDTGKGLPNMRTRAEKLRGSFTMGGGASGGAVVEWRVPLPQM